MVAFRVDGIEVQIGYSDLKTLIAHIDTLLVEHNPDTHLVIAGTDSPNAPGYLERMQREHGATNVT